ncbi:MAG: helix-turn-helix domain-containing protein [Acidobacteriota bacterium]|nr:helix-turn-helix domain-containing protein [Acidobacteriota bacterium]
MTGEPIGSSDASGTSVHAIVSGLSDGVLRSVLLPHPERPVRAVAILDQTCDTAAVSGAIVLAVGVTDSGRLVQLIAEFGAAMAALVVKCPVEGEASLLDSAILAGCGLLVLEDAVDWLQAAGLIQSEIAHLDVGNEAQSSTNPTPAPLDLFDLADAAAAAVGGPVTIEDERGWLLAYSKDQRGSDPVRVETLINRRAPRQFSEIIRSRNLTKHLARSDEPIVVAEVAPGVADRLAVGLHVGSFSLGSMWAVVTSPGSEAVAGFAQIGRRAAAALLRRRTDDQLSHRIELEQLAVILHGGSAISPSAAGFPLPSGFHWVVALAFAPQDPTERAMIRARLEQRLAVMQRASALTVHAGQLSNLWYLILTAPEPRRSDTAEIRGWLDTLLTDHGGNRLPIYAGVGNATADRSALPQSRREAERALAVARRNTSRPCTVDMETAWAAAVLLRWSDLALQAELDTLTPLTTLQDLDARHDTGYVASLRAWLDHHGNIRAAAESLSVHPNTLRYRLEKLQQAAGIDLADTDSRLVLHLQLRASDPPG